MIGNVGGLARMLAPVTFAFHLLYYVVRSLLMCTTGALGCGPHDQALMNLVPASEPSWHRHTHTHIKHNFATRYGQPTHSDQHPRQRCRVAQCKLQICELYSVMTALSIHHTCGKSLHHAVDCQDDHQHPHYLVI